MQVAKDKVVTIDYTLTGPQGNVLDTSQGRGPLAYLHGAGNIIPGLEQALEGKGEGEKLSVNVSPEQGYGSRDENMVQSVPRDRFRGVENIQPGMQFQANTPAGPRVVTVVGVRDASAEELSHRHVHGAGGHHH